MQQGLASGFSFSKALKCRLNFSCIQCPHRDAGTHCLQVMHVVKGFAELEPQPPASAYSAAKNSCPFRHRQPRGSLSSWMSGPGPPPHVVPCQLCPLQGFLSHPGCVFAVLLSAESLARPNATCHLAMSHPFLGPYPPCC